MLPSPPNFDTGKGFVLTHEGELQVIHNAPAVTSRLTRREMVRKLLAGMGAGAVWSRVAPAHPIHKHLADAAAWSQADAKATAAAWKPEFLDAHQNRTLILLAERIMPGSGKARVNRFIDLLLSVDSTENQQKFAASLSVVDSESVQRFGHLFTAISKDRQNQLLTVFSEVGVGRKEGMDHSSGLGSEQTLHNHFDNLKGWITGAYYSSETGMRELGWTGDFVFDSYPGCPHPEGHR
jgi:hypothetical protein